MSTRAMYQFDDYETKAKFRVYVHHDGYPSGAAEKFAATLKTTPGKYGQVGFVWSLPRYEADEFAAGFVAANKQQEGGVRLMSMLAKDIPPDIEYYYRVYFAKLPSGKPYRNEAGDLSIEAYHIGSSFADKKLLFEGPLAQFIETAATIEAINRE